MSQVLKQNVNSQKLGENVWSKMPKVVSTVIKFYIIEILNSILFIIEC